MAAAFGEQTNTIIPADAFPVAITVGQLASAGIDLPVLNVFRMFGAMSGQRLAVDSIAGLNAEIIRQQNVRRAPGASAQASLNQNQLAVLLWHYHDDDVPGPAAAIALTLQGLPPALHQATLTRYLIDATLGKAYEAWQRMGSPMTPSVEQYAELEQAGQLAPAGGPELVSLVNGTLKLRAILSRQAVALLVLSWNGH